MVSEPLCMQGDPLQVEVSNLTSPDTRLSYDFYSIRYCKPSKTLRKFLQGEAFQGSVYTVSMLLALSAFLFVEGKAIFLLWMIQGFPPFFFLCHFDMRKEVMRSSLPGKT